MSRRGLSAPGLALAIGLTAVCLAARAEAQPAPWRRWRTLETTHFRVHVARGLEDVGRRAAAAAEVAYAKLARDLAPPRGTIDLVVSDDADYSNGFAVVSPTNRVVVFATPPIEHAGLRLNEDWLELVITHELTHVFHLDRTRGAWRVAQTLLGRAPSLFPNAYGPSWLVEGLAVHEESRLTHGGRLNDAQHVLYARAGAIEGKLFRLDELSLGTSRFPAGEGAYGYGSLFVDWLARTHGDTSVRRFVDAQAAQLVPYWLDPAAKHAFGTTFGAAYRAWSDSVEHSVGERRAPLPGWRELTSHGWFATSPRWVNDSTLVYTGSDGRETNAAYLLTTSGVRTRLGRRDTREASVPLPDGGFLYAQLDFTNSEEVRSDLYVERNGRTTRLTHGARLIQPDVRADGRIVAVRLGATSADLVVVSADGREIETVRRARPDEVYAEPRWSPDGRRIVVAHRDHGGVYDIGVIFPEMRGVGRTLVEARAVLSAPSWSRDGGTITYITEVEGTPALAFVASRIERTTTERRAPLSQTGLFSAELSPNGRLVAAVTLRADGYHVGVAPIDSIPTRSVASSRIDSATVAAAPAGPAFAPYSPWRTLLPRYWYPIVEPAPARGTRLGAQTAGNDVVGRHAYSAFFAMSTAGSHPIGGIAYRYAGLRRPLFDLGASQDVDDVGDLTSGTPAQVVGTLLKRTRDASFAATFVRPRVRTSASLSVGTGVERRDFDTEPSQYFAELDTTYRRAYTFPRLFVGATFANVQRPAFSISQEDGVGLALTLRERWRADGAARTRSASAVGTAAAFKSLDLPGFAHHVLALRLAGGVADRRTGTSLEVGGTSGTVVEFLPGYTVGEGRRTFGVRGFDAAATYGTRAATASLEYRAPLVLAARGIGLLPFFLDRTSLTLFGDYGIASCPRDPLYSSTCAPAPRIGRPIASAGAEVLLSAAVLEWDAPQTLRFGLAAPVLGRERVEADRVTPYLAFGFSF